MAEFRSYRKLRTYLVRAKLYPFEGTKSLQNSGQLKYEVWQNSGQLNYEV